MLGDSLESRRQLRGRISGVSTRAPLQGGVSQLVSKNLASAGVCRRPFSALQLAKDSDGGLYVTPCCLSWMEDHKPRARVCAIQDITDFWGGSYMTDLRRSVSDGSYSYCSSTTCQYLASGSIQSSLESDIAPGKEFPTLLEYAAEVSCNLTCPSCRNGPKFDHHSDVSLPIGDLLQRGVTHLLMNGSGEFLMSKTLLSLARTFKSSEYPSMKKINLITNGTLFSRETWDGFSHDFKSALNRVMVSIDAATEATYRKVRRGGNYSALLANLHLLCELKHAGNIEELVFSFTICADNMREMPAFLSMAADMGASYVVINTISDWGHMSSTYKDWAVQDAGHPDHAVFLEAVTEAQQLADSLRMPLAGPCFKWHEDFRAEVTGAV